MHKRFVLPVALAVTQLSLAGCPQPSTMDASAMDAMDNPVADVQPVTCGPSVLGDGGVACVGGGPEQFCIPLTTCTVDDSGVASDACCELVG